MEPSTECPFESNLSNDFGGRRLQSITSGRLVNFGGGTLRTTRWRKRNHRSNFPGLDGGGGGVGRKPDAIFRPTPEIPIPFSRISNRNWISSESDLLRKVKKDPHVQFIPFYAFFKFRNFKLLFFIFSFAVAQSVA